MWKANKKIYAEIAVWTMLVLVLSFACYLPMLLERNRVGVPRELSAAKYLFVIVPIAVSVFFAAGRGEFKKWLADLFSEKIRLKSILFCAVAGAIGLIFSFAYSLISENHDLFTNNYPTLLSVFTDAAYLFLTAMLEECAWRGYLLRRLSEDIGTPFSLIYTGIVWAVWHVPMWTIRNSLGFGETAAYLVWTVLISLVLGKFYLKHKNIITTALLHMLFNTCFIMPVSYNIILVGLSGTVMLLTIRKKSS